MTQLSLTPPALMAFFLLLARVSGLVVFVPFFGGKVIPAAIRTAFALGFSLALFPAVEANLPAVPQDPARFVIALFAELLVGMALGLVAQLFLAVMEMAGQLMGFQMGFSVINIIDPQTQVEMSMIAILENFLGVVLFLALNAHYWFIEAVARSYRLQLPLHQHWQALAFEMLRLSSQVFSIGFQLAAPVVMVVLIVDVLLGILGRTAPQIHILIVGLPVKTLLGFVVLMGAANAMVPFMDRHLGRLHLEVFRVVQMIRG